jgi:hypothetical protein
MKISFNISIYAETLLKTQDSIIDTPRHVLSNYDSLLNSILIINNVQSCIFIPSKTFDFFPSFYLTVNRTVRPGVSVGSVRG